MSYLCPVCNGLKALEASCQYCQHFLDDYGRLEQTYDPYSPYREIDDLRMTNGYSDLQTHKCLHLASCPSCGKDHLIAVEEVSAT